MAFPTGDRASEHDIWFAEAQQSLRSGDHARAKDLLVRLLQQDRRNATYWVWMSVVVDSQRERLGCLKNALEIDPNNAAARRGMMIFGALPPAPELSIPARLQKRSWQRAQNAAQSGAAPGNSKRFALMGAAAFTLVLIAAVALFGSRLQPRRSLPAAARATYTAVPPNITTTSTPNTIHSGSPTPLWMLMDATFTPTPLYVNTPHSASEAYRIGIRALQRSEWTQAQQYFRQAATDVAQNGFSAVDVLYYLAENERQSGALESALAGFEQVIATAPDFAPGYAGRARTRAVLQPEQLAAPIEDLQTALRLDPAYTEAALELAELLLRDGQASQALQVLNANNLDALPLADLYRAQAHLAMQQPEQALEYARAANQGDPSLLAGYQTLALALQANGEIRSSLEPLRMYLLYQPGDGQAWYALAQAHLAENDDAAALEALEKATRLGSSIPNEALLRAQLYSRLEQVEQALVAYQEAVRQQPDSYAASLGLGITWMALDEPGKAWDRFERTRVLADTAQQQAEILYWRAQSLEALGENAAALRDYQALLKLPGETVQAQWIALARQRINTLATPPAVTPTPARTATRTPAPTRRTVTPTRRP